MLGCGLVTFISYMYSCDLYMNQISQCLTSVCCDVLCVCGMHHIHILTVTKAGVNDLSVEQKSFLSC